MSQPPGTPPSGTPDEAVPPEQVGPYRLEELLRRDRLGEVYAAEGPDGRVRLRLCSSAATRSVLVETLQRMSALRAPGVAQVVDALVVGERVSVVTALDAGTLDRSLRRRRLDAAAGAALGVTLLDGLAALHGAGLVHGAVSAASVGVDAAGAVRWLDAGIAPALTGVRTPSAQRAGVDVVACATLLRDAARLSPSLAALADTVVSATPAEVPGAAALASAWREGAAADGTALPPAPAGLPVAALAAATAQRRRAGAGLRPRPGVLRALAAVLVVAGLGIVPAAAFGPGGRAPFQAVTSYLPLRSGQTLTYRLTAQTATTVTLRVQNVRDASGTVSATLVPTAAAAGLPLGLSGGTLTVVDQTARRSTAGGAVRDLVGPLVPGTTWTDELQQAGTAGARRRETRTVLGPVSLDEPAGHYDDCAVLSETSQVILPGGQGESGSALLWFCPGVGLARAELTALQQRVIIDLMASR